ncbi:MAG: AraC family ligand binding domain-containing protein, partial [Cyanobacteria bacterium]|nr:AraC family ligand binding domain-containing protein [Cyanobacteriota bacterium]
MLEFDEPAAANTAEYYAFGPYQDYAVETREIRTAGLQMVRIRQPGGRFPEPAFDQFGINLVLQGATKARFDFGASAFEFELRPGVIAIAPPGAACDYLTEGSYEVLCVCILSTALDRSFPEFAGMQRDLGWLHSRAIRSPLLEQLCLALWDAAAQSSDASTLFIESATVALFSELVRLAKTVPAPLKSIGLKPVRLQRIREFMWANLERDVDLKELAGIAGLSPSQF